MNRRDWLLAAVQQAGYSVTTHEAEQLYAESPWPTSGRNTARKDLRALAARGLLVAVDIDGRRSYWPVVEERDAA